MVFAAWPSPMGIHSFGTTERSYELRISKTIAALEKR
jgi:hypothetical protein